MNDLRVQSISFTFLGSVEQCLKAKTLKLNLIVPSTLSIQLMTTRWLKKTIEKSATIPNWFCGQLTMQQVSLIAGIVVLGVVELGGQDELCSLFIFPFNFTGSSNCFGIVWS